MDVRMKVEGLGEGTPPERSGGGVRAPEVPPRRAGEVGTESEVEAKATRRRFTAEYKLWVLEQADRCEKPGELGALLRREGLYSSHLTQWREQRRGGMISGLRPKRRGRKPEPRTVERKRIEELEKENVRLRRRLAQAETIISFQKKACELLGIPLKEPEGDGND